ncbi:MAG: OmpA family protein, partial [Bacteroidota bacterium]
TIVNSEKKKSKVWIYIITIALIVITVIAVIFILNKNNTDKGNIPTITDSMLGTNSQSHTGTKDTINSDSSSEKSSPALGESKSVDPNLIAGELNNKIPFGFESGSATPSNVDDKLVNDIINFLSKNKNSKIQVYGYASSEGDISFNEILSKKRAESFKNYLVEKGIESDRIIANGKGIADPIASNETEEGKQKNRRVEIELTN